MVRGVGAFGLIAARRRASRRRAESQSYFVLKLQLAEPVPIRLVPVEWTL